MQEIIVGLLFITAFYFISKRLWDNFRHKKSNAGCAKCDMNAEVKK